MSLEHAILGFLSYRPFSGYDLKKIFDASVRHFWTADQSQIYRTLARMTQKGFVVQEVIEQSERPDRKVYHITKNGQSELQQWLQSPHQPEENRSAQFIQIFFAGQLSDEDVLEMFEGFTESMRTVLEMYALVPQDGSSYADITRSPRELFFWMLTLEAGQRAMQANLLIVEDILQRIRNGQVPKE